MRKIAEKTACRLCEAPARARGLCQNHYSRWSAFRKKFKRDPSDAEIAERRRRRIKEREIREQAEDGEVKRLVQAYRHCAMSVSARIRIKGMLREKGVVV